MRRLAHARCGAGAPATPTAGAPAQVDYARDIFPILEQTCFECHGPKKGRGQLRLHTRALTMKGGVSGPVIVPGKSADSLLVQRLLGPAGTVPHEDQMPLEKDPLPPAAARPDPRLDRSRRPLVRSLAPAEAHGSDDRSGREANAAGAGAGRRRAKRRRIGDGRVGSRECSEAHATRERGRG